MESRVKETTTTTQENEMKIIEDLTKAEEQQELIESQLRANYDERKLIQLDRIERKIANLLERISKSEKMINAWEDFYSI